MKKIILTSHAERRMQKRNISLHEVQQTLLFPDEDIPLDLQERKATKMYNQHTCEKIAGISHTSVNRIFHQYHLPTKAYHPKGKSDGIKHHRYRRRGSNELWHLDFKGPIKLFNGQNVYLLVVLDDFSRFCMFIRFVYRKLGHN